MTCEAVYDSGLKLWPNGYGMSLRLNMDTVNDMYYAVVYFGREVTTSFSAELGITINRDDNPSLGVIEVYGNLRVVKRVPTVKERDLLLQSAIQNEPDSILYKTSEDYING